MTDMPEKVSLSKFIKSFFDPIIWAKNIRYIIGTVLILALILALWLLTHRNTIRPNQSQNKGTIINNFNDKSNEVGIAPFVFRYSDKTGWGAMLEFKRRF